MWNYKNNLLKCRLSVWLMKKKEWLLFLSDRKSVFNKTNNFITWVICKFSSVTQSYQTLCDSMGILFPACASFSPAFLMMYAAYKLNKQGEWPKERRWQELATSTLFFSPMFFLFFFLRKQLEKYYLSTGRRIEPPDIWI